MTDLVQHGAFLAHSGETLPFKVECDALSLGSIASLARIISTKLRFSKVYGVPRGGLLLAHALEGYCEIESFLQYPVLIVDDVLTTGQSMEEAREIVSKGYARPVIGVVIFARGPLPDWVQAIFTVNGVPS